MNVVDWLLGRGRSLAPPQRARLDAWRALPEPDLGSAHAGQRFVVVDVESTGLDVFSDRLIAIGAVTVESSRIALDRSFYRVLRQQRASHHDNILVHGIGGTAQTGGDDPVAVLLDFLEHIGKSPLIGFHARFDEIMIRNAVRKYLGGGFRRTWLDLADLAPAVPGAPGGKSRGLDEWLATFNIVNYSRHDALADALATAQLFQVMARTAEGSGSKRTADLIEAARSQEWLSKQPR